MSSEDTHAPSGAGQQVYFHSPLPSQIGSEFELAGDEGHHAFAVRRRRVGDQLLLTDGVGGWAQVQVVAVAKHAGTVVVMAAGRQAPAPVQIQVVQALPKADRAGDTVAGLTQAGAQVIVPWQSRHSVSDWRAGKASKGQQRWQRIADEAAKQSRRLWWPVISEPISRLAEMSADIVLVCDETAHVPLPEVLASPPIAQRLAAARQITAATATDQLAAAPPLSIAVVVGPEGGFSEAERNELQELGTPVSLGPIVWRTALAGTIATAFVAAAAGHW